MFQKLRVIPTLRGRGRFLAAAAPIVMALALAGCEPTISRNDPLKASRPLTAKTVSELETKEMAKTSPILMRIYKQESELEVWKKDKTGRYAHFKTYPICKWSGDLGPKQKEGDRQAPEGFYQITRSQMNPNSSYYLSFDMGYPNRYDKAFNRTGSNLMVHGDCSSRGCYAMTDEAIAEVYALARESFAGGQTAFQVQALPFRMTAENFAKHRNNPNVAFWKMLKEGVDQFEVSRLEPKVDVCERKYVFNARFKSPALPAAVPANASPIAPVAADPAGKCPTYEIEPSLAQAVAERKREFEQRYAELAPAMQAAPIRSGIDGGMHPVFLAGKTNPAADRLSGPDSPTLAYAPTPVAVPAPAAAPIVAPVTVVAREATPVSPAAATARPVAAPQTATVSKPVVTARPVVAKPAAKPAETVAVAAVQAPSTEMVSKPAEEKSTVGKLFSKINPWSKD